MIVTTAKEHDRNQLKVHVDDNDALYVFDRGYVDYKRFNRMTDEGDFFISRIKKNTVIREVESFTLSKHSNIVSDQMIYLGTPQKRIENVFRLIKVADTR